MKIKEIMNRNLITVSLDENINNVLAKMKNNNIHQVPVLQNGILHGLVELKNIVTKNIDPDTAKAESVKVSCPVLNPNDEVGEAVIKFIQSGFRALPVVDGNKIVGIVSETDFLKDRSVFDSKKKVEDVMSECISIVRKDSAGKIKKVMLYNNISRIPVVDKGKIVGAVGTMELAKFARMKSDSIKTGGKLKERGFREKISSEGIYAESLMKQTKIISSDLALEKAVPFMLNNDELYIEKDGKFFVVTPKDVLETLKRENKGVLVDITNIKDEDNYTIEKMHQIAAETVKKVGKILDGVESLIIRIERMHKSGLKTKYSVRARLYSPSGLLVSHAWGWDVVSVTQECLSKLEKEVIKKRGKFLTIKKRGVMK